MPLPKPMPKEQKGEFIQRCIMNDTMVREYKDIDQRIAVCYQQLEKHELENGKSRKTTKNR